MILIELFFGMVIAAFVLLFLPLVLLMAGVGVALLLWILAPFAMLGGLILWLIFPGSYGLA
ncbi:MAG TPA: hypothetical protein VHN11_13960, partial [Xanthobacteraceae bacterium]|nr:hypothetical protein [Xanthobacteraceae bacterium]